MAFVRLLWSSRSLVGKRTHFSLTSRWRQYCSQSPELQTVSMRLQNGRPVIPVRLPSTQQLCNVSVSPLTETVGTFLDNISSEDGGITSIAMYSRDGNLISNSTEMWHALSSDFDLAINGVKHSVTVPDEYKDTLSSDSHDHLKDVVHRLHSALCLDEHQICKNRDLRGQLEKLQDELRPLEEQRLRLAEETRRRTNMLLWGGLGAMSVQFGFFARLTWGDYSWDIMEPITYFTTCATAIGMYVYFALVREEYLYNSTEDRLYLRRLRLFARKRGFDINRYNYLKDEIEKKELDLGRLEGPLKLNLPTPPPEE